MRYILITGKDSYIGTSVENWLLKEPENYHITTLNMQDPNWKDHDFSKYDNVLHVAGIAHSDTKNVDAATKKMYYMINTDLTIETAQKAKESGVKQFIFMSSIIVYGSSAFIGQEKIITEETIPQPANFYGDSKLQAEKGLEKINDGTFKVAIIRPPMIYGKGAKGNYSKLSKIAKKVKIFPDIDNQRSMLHIDNLCEFIRLLITEEDSGVFAPQNNEYVKTSELVREIASIHNNRIKLTKLLNPFLRHGAKKIDLLNKVFGSLVYDQKMSLYKEKYQIRNFRESIELTER